MPKSDYDRYSLQENQLKKILIRVDYSGVTQIENWVENIKTSFIKNIFGNYFKRINNNATLDLSNLTEIAKKQSIPISEIIKEPVHTFTESKFSDREDIVTLDITSLYFILSIECVRYKSIDPYIELISQLIENLLSSDSFIQIKRIGIRKIGGHEFDTLEEVYQVYEKDIVFCNLIENDDINMINREYTDRFFKTKEQIKINYSRLCRNIKIKDKNKIQVILDMDGYIDDFIITKNNYKFPEETKNILADKINNYLFELFKSSVTLKYLEHYGKITK
jgi:uncharacterized protein (TIGR04255 family)